MNVINSMRVRTMEAILFTTVFVFMPIQTRADNMPLRELAGHTGAINSIAFATDGQTVVSSSDDKTARLWDVITGQARQTLQTSDPVVDACFWPGGKAVATIGFPKPIVTLWDAATGKKQKTLEIAKSDWPLAISPDGKIVACAATGTKMRGAIQFWDSRSLDRGVVTTPPKAAANDKGSAAKASSPTSLPLRTLAGHEASVKAIAFSPDGKTFASAGSDKIIKLWDVQTGQVQHSMAGHATVVSVSFSPDSQALASACTNTNVKVWDVQKGALLHLMEGHRDIVMAVAFSPDGKTLASAGLDGTVRLWDVQDGSLQHMFKASVGAVLCIAFSPDGKILASGGDDKLLKLWSVETIQNAPA